MTVRPVSCQIDRQLKGNWHNLHLLYIHVHLELYVQNIHLMAYLLCDEQMSKGYNKFPYYRTSK